MQFRWPISFKKSKERKYEGASKGRRTKGWITGSGDANSMIKHDLPWLRERSRYLRRNNPYLHKAIELVTNNVVGKGVEANIANDPGDAAQDLWKAWAGSTECDFEGRDNLSGIQRKVFDAVQESGEVLVRRRFVDNPNFPIKYQVLESDFINGITLEGLQENGSTVVQGVEFDAQGKRVAYHLYENHPGALTTTNNFLKTNRVPAEDIYHLFKGERPGQVRGVPWSSPVMIRLRDLDGFEDAALLNQKIAALFVAFVTDISADVDCEDDSDLGESLVPGIIEHLPPGKTIEFTSPPEFKNYKEFVTSQLRAIAAGYGVSYESLAGDLSEVNFSSARMGWIEMGRNVDSWRKHILIGQFLSGVQKDFKLLARLNGVNASNITFEWIPPRRELIDPSKEIKAMKDEIRSGLTSRTAAIQSLGRDAESVNAQIKKDNEKADADGLIFDSDPRQTNQSGTIQGGTENAST